MLAGVRYIFSVDNNVSTQQSYANIDLGDPMGMIPLLRNN